MSDVLRVGYIGLGLMGKSIARNILKAGFPVVVHNRSQAAVEELVAQGAIPADSPAETAAQVDIVFTNLPDSPDVEAVALGKTGILEGAYPGLIFVDNSTIKPATSRRIAEEMAEKKVLCLDGAEETDGWIDETTVRIWKLSGTDMPRSMCPDIPEVFGVGVDSLFALDLKTLELTPLGPWRCNPLQ